MKNSNARAAGQSNSDSAGFTLTVSAVAQAAGTNETLVRNLANRGAIRVIRDSNNRRLFSTEAIDVVKRYLKNRDAATAAA
jgi:DNA-binding transcriptional MerR regulator